MWKARLLLKQIARVAHRTTHMRFKNTETSTRSPFNSREAGFAAYNQQKQQGKKMQLAAKSDG